VPPEPKPIQQSPLIAHIIYRLGVGGLENGLVNLINRGPDRYRHAIICLKDADDFRNRLRGDVPVFQLQRKEGQDFGLVLRLYRLLRQLHPAIVHTRNLAAVECQLPAWLAGVPARVHGEHGWDVFDPDGSNRKYQWLRRVYKVFVHHYIPLSRHLEGYLRERIRVPEARMTRICNGVDTAVFHPAEGGKDELKGCPFDNGAGTVVVGTVGRMHGVKDQINLVRAFIGLVERRPEVRARVRLVLAGDGPLRAEAAALLEGAGLAQLAWLPGARSDIADILRGLDIFVLPSKAEGISNTILEAMATSLPVVATDVGGNPELVVDGQTGRLVPKEDPAALAAALLDYLDRPELIAEHGAAGLARVREGFSLDGMVNRYMAVYDALLNPRRDQ
jgi:sugar transferase (PEP-CTERM/EpsH1 system associated)